MPEQISNQVWKLSEYGVAGIVLAVVLACLIALMWWLLKYFEKVQARADKGQEIMVALKTAIDANNAIILAHNARAEEAAGYVRQEHKEMCDCLKETTILLKAKPCLIEK